jgi:hypothetical protein
VCVWGRGPAAGAVQESWRAARRAAPCPLLSQAAGSACAAVVGQVCLAGAAVLLLGGGAVAGSWPSVDLQQWGDSALALCRAYCCKARTQPLKRPQFTGALRWADSAVGQTEAACSLTGDILEV